MTKLIIHVELLNFDIYNCMLNYNTNKMYLYIKRALFCSSLSDLNVPIATLPSLQNSLFVGTGETTL